MAETDNTPRDPIPHEHPEGDFDVKKFLIAVVVAGIVVAIALYLLLLAEGRHLLPHWHHREPHSQLIQPALQPNAIAPGRVA